MKIVTQLNEEQRLTENREQILDIVGKFGDKADKVVFLLFFSFFSFFFLLSSLGGA